MKKKQMAWEIERLGREVEILHVGLDQLAEFLEIMQDEVQELRLEVDHSVRRFPKLSVDKTVEELRTELRQLEQEEMNRDCIKLFLKLEKDGSNGQNA